MRYHKLMVLATSAIILAIVASGIASAATVPFDGTSRSTHRSTFPAYTAFVNSGDSPARGNYDAAIGDFIQWSTGAQNYDAGQHTVYIMFSGDGMTSGTRSYTVPEYASSGGVITGNDYDGGKITNTGYFQIQEKHRYEYNGEVVYTAYDNVQMSVN